MLTFKMGLLVLDLAFEGVVLDFHTHLQNEKSSGLLLIETLPYVYLALEAVPDEVPL
jgi:hypothetical protein